MGQRWFTHTLIGVSEATSAAYQLLIHAWDPCYPGLRCQV